MPRTTRRGPRLCSRPSSRSNHDEAYRMTKSQLLALAAALTLAAPAAAQVKLNGAGAPFPNVIHQDWMLSYNQAHPGVQLNYQSIGSGGGIRQFSDGTVDFGATDAPMKDSAIAAINGNVLHIPTVLGGDVPTYNLPDVKETLRFTPDLLADIFLGKVTKWSDARIAATNPGVKLPDQDILVVHRSDGSGTTFIWTDYLSKVSPAWEQSVNRGTSFTWLLVHKQYDDAAKAAALVKFVWWAETEGQSRAAALGYAPLPKQLRPWIEARLKSITVAGKSVWNTTAAR